MNTDKNIFIIIPNYKGRLLTVKRDAEWFIDMTALGNELGKPWRTWKFNNKKVIDTFQVLEKKKLIKTTGPKNKQHTWVSSELALRALADYDHILSYHIFKKFEQSLISSADENLYENEIRELMKQVEIGEALVAAAEGRKIKPVLLNHSFLAYGYECNNHCKFGNSFVNSNGQRPKSHRTSVPNLAIGYLIYSSKEHLQKLNVAIKQRFKIKDGAPEHASCKIEELRSFVYDYMRIMKYPYVEEDIHQLKLLNIFLK